MTANPLPKLWRSSTVSPCPNLNMLSSLLSSLPSKYSSSYLLDLCGPTSLSCNPHSFPTFPTTYLFCFSSIVSISQSHPNLACRLPQYTSPQPVIFLFSIFFCLFNSELLTTNRPLRYHCSFSLVSQDPVDTCLLLGPSLLLSKVITFRCVACRPCVTRSVCRLSTKGRTDDHFFPIQSPPLALYLRCSIFILITLGPARSSSACIQSLYTSHCLTYSQATKPGLPTCRSLFAIACYKGQQLR